MLPHLIFAEKRSRRCSRGRCGAAGCLKTCLGCFSTCLGTSPILALLQVGACWSPAALASSVPCCPGDEVLLVFQPMFAKRCLFLCFVSPLSLAGSEPLSWPAASSGRKAAKATSSWKHSLLGKGMSYFLAYLLDLWPPDYADPLSSHHCSKSNLAKTSSDTGCFPDWVFSPALAQAEPCKFRLP